MLFSDGTVSYLMISTDDSLNTTNDELYFPEPIKVFEQAFEIKFQEGSVHKYLNFRVCQPFIRFSIYQNDDIMELVNEWLPTGKYGKFDTSFCMDSTYQK